MAIRHPGGAVRIEPRIRVYRMRKRIAVVIVALAPTISATRKFELRPINLFAIQLRSTSNNEFFKTIEDLFVGPCGIFDKRGEQRFCLAS